MRPKAPSLFIPSSMSLQPFTEGDLGPTFAPAVAFGKTTSEGFDRSGNNTGVADTGFFSFSAFVKSLNGGVNQNIMHSSSSRRNVSLTTTDQLRVELRNGANTQIFIFVGAADSIPADGNWHHICCAVDVSTATETWYVAIDGSSQSGSPLIIGPNNVDHTDNGPAIGNQVLLGQTSFDGSIAQLAVWPRLIDWSQASKLELVYKSGKCVLLPNNGDIDGGGAADYVFNKGVTTGHQNGGDADDWQTATSGLADDTGPEVFA